MIYFIYYIIFINIVGFILCAYDKRISKNKRKRRIPERTFLYCAAIGGSIGFYIGMWVTHHKTKHLKFTLGIPIILLVQIGTFLYLFINALKG